ncbi:hypothetical protein [Crocinitomix algicola]|uniref:hypothetical protein n=1 Tax=Crocinitomix algicola TaxID=1740263 RepID=UPI0015865D32|nr:hypothetical protein [Crocinitomix algicola]
MIYILIVSYPVIGQSTFQVFLENPEGSVTQIRHDIVENEAGDIYAMSDVTYSKKM